MILSRNGNWLAQACAAAEPPDCSAENDKADGDQLRTGHDATENRATAGVSAEKFEEVAGDAVEAEIRRENLTIEFLAFEEPHEQKEIEKLDTTFKKLCGFEGLVQRRADNFIGQRIGKRDTPKMCGRLAVATSGSEATETANRVAEGKAGSKSVASGKHGHVVLANEPRRRQKASDQSAGKNATRLQSAQTKDFTRMRRVRTPVIHDVENLRADDAAKDDDNPKVPGVVGINILFDRVAYADPKASENAQRDQEAVGGQIKVAVMEESGKHYVIRCKILGFGEGLV